jgi:hypothetical protein
MILSWFVRSTVFLPVVQTPCWIFPPSGSGLKSRGWPVPPEGIICLPDPGNPDDPGQGTLTADQADIECRYFMFKKKDRLSGV